MTDLARTRILVVGADGFIGRHVAAHLLANNAEVAALDLSKTEFSDPRVSWIVGSVADEALFASAVAGCATVIFLASSSLPASANADLGAEISYHVRNTVRAAEICDSQGVNCFIFASSGGTVYGVDSTEKLKETDRTLPRNAYGVSKLAIEHYLRVLSKLRRMRTVTFRIANPYGEGQRTNRSQGFVAAAMAAAFSGEKLPLWGDGSAIRDFIHVEDVAMAFVAAAGYEGEPALFNIGSSQGTSLLEVLAKVERITGKKINTAFEPARNIDVRVNVLDIQLAQDCLGWSPRISIDEGLKRTADWWRAQSAAAAPAI